MQHAITEIVADYPAMAIVRREVKTGIYYEGKYHTDISYTPIIDGESLAAGRKAIRNPKEIIYSQFKPGSVVSYALRNGDDPIAGIDRARELKHPLHWINGCGVVISNSSRPKEVWTLIEDGMTVLFEGRLFTILTDRDHVRLRPFVLKEEAEKSA